MKIQHVLCFFYLLIVATSCSNRSQISASQLEITPVANDNAPIDAIHTVLSSPRLSSIYRSDLIFPLFPQQPGKIACQVHGYGPAASDTTSSAGLVIPAMCETRVKQADAFWIVEFNLNWKAR